MKFDVKTAAFALPFGLAIIMGVVVFGKITDSNQSIETNSQSLRKTTAPVYETQSRGGGNITVDVTPEKLSVGKNPKFTVSIDTHSGSLDFEVAPLATLRDVQGNVYKDATWDGSPPGGHHRTGTLTFNRALVNRGEITLTLQNISGVAERNFSWTVQ